MKKGDSNHGNFYKYSGTKLLKVSVKLNKLVRVRRLTSIRWVQTKHNKQEIGINFLFAIFF